MTFVILLIFILEKRYEIQMNDTETKNTAVKAPALMSTRPVTAQDALDQCEKLSPMMVHYCQTKTGLTDPANTILFYRLGDFYEMFFEDATLVSKELELTLTGKDCGMEDRAPMCGIPYHAAEGYINRLVENGHKVAICEQMEDPKQAKGMVKREVIRVVTPGTTLIPQGLDETKNNYIMSIVCMEGCFGISTADISTGQCLVTEMDKPRRLVDEITKFMPAEIICNQSFLLCGIDVEDLRTRLHICVNALEDWYFDDDICRRTLQEQFHAATMEGLGIADYNCGTIAAGALFQYLHETQKSDLSHMNSITPYVTDKYMLIDSSSRRNLELVETLREKQKRGSLLWVLDKTRTAMGARLLRSYVEQPLIDEDEINARLDAVEALTGQAMIREEIREYLRPVYDLERLVGRISYQSANPRDLIAFKSSLQMLPYIKQLLNSFDGGALAQIQEDLDPLEDLYQLVDAAIVDDPPYLMRDGGMIKDGYNETVDNYRHAKTEGKQWLSELEASEREKTGIKNMKVKYNKVFGYYLEVTNSFKDLVPDYYTRKQTLTNAERYITPRLKELEDTILGAEDKLYALEYDLFCTVRDTVAGEAERIQRTAQALARLDVYASLSYVAEHNHYVRPKLNSRGKIDIKDGRHPVVEKMIPNDMFIANDTLLDNGDHRVSVITGPNMAGKSTYMRQVAVLVLMAQAGSFIPAKEASICPVDRIFTRIGASDDILTGQSTFMVEMKEVSYILKHATSRSLLILDEIGRGTSTFDGMSIARAVIEYCLKNVHGLTLFATHYHELIAMADDSPKIKNYTVAVKERGKHIKFLRRIVPGGADRSYGLHVARLAGLPESLLKRADVILEELEKEGGGTMPAQRPVVQEPSPMGDSLFSSPVIDKLLGVDVSSMTPIEAISFLYSLQKDAKEGSGIH